MGGAIPGLVVLDFIREQAEQALKSKHPSMTSASASASRFLCCLSRLPSIEK